MCHEPVFRTRKPWRYAQSMIKTSILATLLLAGCGDGATEPEENQPDARARRGRTLLRPDHDRHLPRVRDRG